jgi:hypothetical protein
MKIKKPEVETVEHQKDWNMAEQTVEIVEAEKLIKGAKSELNKIRELLKKASKERKQDNIRAAMLALYIFECRWFGQNEEDKNYE